MWRQRAPHLIHGFWAYASLHHPNATLIGSADLQGSRLCPTNRRTCYAATPTNIPHLQHCKIPALLAVLNINKTKAMSRTSSSSVKRVLLQNRRTICAVYLADRKTTTSHFTSMRGRKRSRLRWRPAIANNGVRRPASLLWFCRLRCRRFARFTVSKIQFSREVGEKCIPREMSPQRQRIKVMRR